MTGDPELQKHQPPVEHLDTQGMSSDESGDERQRTINYLCVYPCWHSHQLATLLWETDAIAVENQVIPIGTHKKTGTQA